MSVIESVHLKWAKIQSGDIYDKFSKQAFENKWNKIAFELFPYFPTTQRLIVWDIGGGLGYVHALFSRLVGYGGYREYYVRIIDGNALEFPEAVKPGGYIANHEVTKDFLTKNNVCHFCTLPDALPTSLRDILAPDVIMSFACWPFKVDFEAYAYVLDYYAEQNHFPLMITDVRRGDTNTMNLIHAYASEYVKIVHEEKKKLRIVWK